MAAAAGAMLPGLLPARARAATGPGGFVDARRDGLPEQITGRICIIGAGAAGLTLARALAKTTDGIVLVESGGFDIDGATQTLFAGKQLGLDYHNLTSCRLRYFGGTTNHWGGYCRANDPIDYEGRAAVNLPEWPFDADHLAPYIAQAATQLGLNSAFFDPAALLRDKGFDAGALLETQSGIFQTKVFQLTQSLRLGPLYHDEIGASDRITTYTNLNLTHIQLAENGQSVQHLDCATLDGAKTRITADRVILACHAIENARLLMASNDVMPGGIGNTHDHVGRYFMDHIYIHASQFVPGKRFPALYDAQYLRQHNLNANLSFTDDFLRKQDLLQYYCRFTPRFVSDETRAAMTDVRRGFMKPGDLDFLGDMAQIGSQIWPAMRSSSRRFRDHVPPEFYTLEHRLEQAPNPASRVVLSDRRDALGNLIADLDWQVSDTDIDSFQRGQAAVGTELERLGYGTLIPEQITRAMVEERIIGHYHHIGTTRMSETAQTGVVDPQGKVHGVENLYVAGSSVFPTAGYSGPTMMILAMALRQADHLAEQVQ